MVFNKEIKNIIRGKHGIFRTADIISHGFHHRHINKLLKENKIIRLKRGVYQWIANGEG